MTSDGRTTEFRSAADGQHDRLLSLGKYDIRRRLGAGGMGTVFLAVDRELNRTVALKVLPKERAENPTLVRRFKSEAQAAAQLEHKNIVHVYEAGEINGFLYIALEYVDGIDVHELVVKRGVLPVKRSINIVKQVARAIEHAASRGIVHRDIKPANLLIKRDGTVKLADMGLARSIDEATETNITRAGMTVGTVDYMSPEQARSSQAADVRSDIYSLGCTWYHMLTGGPPFPDGGLTEKLQAHAMGKRPNPQAENDAVPEAVVAVMHRMMARRPEDRHQTPQELLEDLELASRSLTTLNASVLEALAEESGSSSGRGSRGRSSGGPAALPPKDGFKPVDVSSGRAIDIDVLRFAVPAVLVIAVLGVLVWTMQRSGDALTGEFGGGAFPVPQQQDAEDRGDGQPAAAGAAGEQRSEQAGEDALADVSDSQQPAGPDPVVETPFPGAEDVRTTSAGPPLIPNWVDKFRSESVPPAHKVLVTRRAGADDGRQHRRLDQAFKALPRDGGVIELDGDGPFVLEPVSITSRGPVQLKAADGHRAVVYLSPLPQEDERESWLTVRGPQLEIENVHFVMVDPPEIARTVLTFEGGEIALQNCSVTVDGETGDPVTAISVVGPSGSSGRGKPSNTSTGRCFLENVLCRGDRLTAVRLNGEAGELVMGNCLLHAGDAPAIVLDNSESRSSAHRTLRLLATTVISNESAVQFTNAADHPPQQCDVFVRKSLLACTRTAGADDPAMVVLDGWTEEPSSIGSSRAAGINWSTEESVYLNWPALVRMIAADGAASTPVVTADEWRPFWNKALPSDAVVGLSESPTGWDRPASITPQQVSSEEWSSRVNGEVREDVGCRPGDLDEIPLGMIEHVTVASRAPDVPENFGSELPVNESPIAFDLIKRSSLGNLLANESYGDGTHILATGAGPYKLEPIVIANKSIRLEFQQSGSAPLIIQSVAARDGSNPPLATITLRNATLDLVGAHFKMPATNSTLQPQWLFRLENSSLSIRGCTFEGPSTPTDGHLGFIQFADGDSTLDSDSEPAEDRCVLIEDSFLISPGRLMSGPVRWNSMILRNSVFVSQSDILNIQLDEAGLQRHPTAVMDHCTFSAGGAAVRFEGDVPAADDLGPLDLVVKESVFAGAADGESGGRSAVVVSRETPDQTDHHIRWWGSANGYAAALKQLVRTGETSESAGGFADAWTAVWGAGHEAHPLSSATDVIFAASRPRWNDLQPSHFALAPASPAATWSVGRTAIGADVEQVGAATGDDQSSGDRTTNQRATRKPSRTPPTRARNRNPF